MNTTIFLWINGWAGRNRFLDDLMIFCASYLIYVVFAVAAVCAVLLVRRREWPSLTYLVATLVASFALLQVASRVYVDHRPFVDHHVTQLVAHAAGSSFPSDHTTATTAIALGLLVFTRFKWVGWAILGGAVLIGFARIFVGIHYPIDIVGGLLTGGLGVLAVYLTKLVRDRRALQRAP